MKNIGLFYHSKEDKLFSAFASDLGHGIFEKFGKGRMGVIVFNNKTDNVVVFERLHARHHNIAGPDGQEIMCWDLAPTMEAIAHFPRLSGYTMRIYND